MTDLPTRNRYGNKEYNEYDVSGAEGDGETHTTTYRTLRPQWMVKLVKMIQFMWETGSIPMELGWTVLVLIPRGDVYNKGIRQLEVV